MLSYQRRCAEHETSINKRHILEHMSGLIIRLHWTTEPPAPPVPVGRHRGLQRSQRYAEHATQSKTMYDLFIGLPINLCVFRSCRQSKVI